MGGRGPACLARYAEPCLQKLVMLNTIGKHKGKEASFPQGNAPKTSCDRLSVPILSYCGVRCLATLNVSFAIIFALMALFLGSTILTLETDCSETLFWCYEVICLGLVFLYGGTYFSLHRKAAVIMDEGEFYGSRTMGMELLEASVDPELERRLNAGFRSWMGSSILSSDDEEGPATGGLDDVGNDNLYDNSRRAREA